jgi:flagellar basal body-associated protein FliL
MRILIMLAIVVAIVLIGYGFSTQYFRQPVSTAAAVSNTMSPHEIHLNYKRMKELPVHDVKDAF